MSHEITLKKRARKALGGAKKRQGRASPVAIGGRRVTGRTHAIRATAREFKIELTT